MQVRSRQCPVLPTLAAREAIAHELGGDQLGKSLRLIALVDGTKMFQLLDRKEECD